MLNMRALVKGYNESARGYNELLPWMCLWDERLVATMDQGLMGVYVYDGVDAEGKLAVETDAAVNAFEAAFQGFTSGNTVWSFIDRRRTHSYPGGSFSNQVADYVDDRWRTTITDNQYQNFYSLAVHQRSAGGAMALFDSVDMILKEENVGIFRALGRAAKTQLSFKARQTFDQRRMTAAQDKLLARLDDLEQGMGRLGLRRLEGEQLLSYLHMRANPASSGQAAFPVPRTPAFLNNLLANDQIDRLPRALKFSNNEDVYVGVVSLKGWPDDACYPGRLDFLTNLQGEVTVAHCFRFSDRAVSEKAIGGIERYNISKSVPFFHHVMASLSKSEPTKFNPGRQALAEDARSALIEIYEANRAFGYHNMTVLCYGRTLDEMEDVRSQVHTRLRDSGFTGFTEGMHQLTAFTQTLPGQWGASVRWSNVSFGNASDLMPIRTLWSGPDECAHLSTETGRNVPSMVSLPTDSGVPFFWDPFTAGVGHATIIGPTRTGKSVFINFCLSQFRKYEPCRTVIFDKDYTCRVPTLMQDGEHYDLSPDVSDGMRLAPMALASDPKNHPFLVRWISQMIKLGRLDQPLVPEEVEAITNVVRGMVNLPKELRTLGHVASGLGSNLGAYLTQWVRGGTRGHWFDNPAADLELGDHVCFEMKRLFDDPDVAVLAMDYLFHVVEQRLDDTPTIIYTEETWFFLRNPEFVERLDDYIRTLGKRNAALWMTTQGLQELTASDTLRTMLESIPNRIFLPNARIMAKRDLYEDAMGLNAAQVERIMNAEPKRDYYIVTPDMARMATVRLPDDVLAIVSSSSRARATFERHYATRHRNPDWKREYIEEMTYEAA